MGRNPVGKVEERLEERAGVDGVIAVDLLQRAERLLAGGLPRSDDGVLADSDAFQNRRIHPDPNVICDFYPGSF